MANERPSFQFYPSDWMSDMGLRLCSLGARGLWIEMLSIMHEEGNPYGHLTLSNGKDIHEGELARMVGADPEVVKSLLAELNDKNIFSRTESGTIYSRRMVSDERLRQVRAAGGFKALQNPNVPKPKALQEDIPSRYTLEDIHVGIPSSSSSTSSSSSSSKDKKGDTPRRAPRRQQTPTECDDDFLESLQKEEAYRHLNVRHLYLRMVQWCKQKRKQPTRRRLINWLNNTDTPMVPTNSRKEAANGQNVSHLEGGGDQAGQSIASRWIADCPIAGGQVSEVQRH